MPANDWPVRAEREEYQSLRLQPAILKRGQHSQRLPCAFAEQGVAMLSSVLRSPRAARVNVEIMRAFVRLRGLLASHAELARKLSELEVRVGMHDEQIAAIFEAMRRLMAPPEPPDRRKIGFLSRERPADYGKAKPRRRTAGRK